MIRNTAHSTGIGRSARVDGSASAGSNDHGKENLNDCSALRVRNARPPLQRTESDPRPATNKGRLSPVRPSRAIAATRRDEAVLQTVAGWRVRDTARRVVAFLREEPAREGMLHRPHT